MAINSKTAVRIPTHHTSSVGVANESAYTLNIVPINFNDSEIEVGFLSYEAHSTLQELRKKHCETHVFRRHKATQIVAVPITRNAPKVGQTFGKIILSQNLTLCADLIRNTLLRKFHEWGRPSQDYIPLRVSGAAREDLLRMSLPSGVQCPNWLGVQPHYIIDVRVMHFDDGEAGVYLTFNMRTVNRVDLNCSELLERNFLLDGCYVERRIPHPDFRLADKFKLLGRVSEVDGNTLYLTDSRGEKEVDASEVYLDARREAFNELLLNVFKSRAPQIRMALDRQQAQIQSGAGRFQKIHDVIEKFGRYQVVPGVGFTLGKLLDQRQNDFPTVRTTPKTTLIFHPRAGHMHVWNEGGIQKYGPYSSETFTPARPRICVVCKSIDRGRIDNFLSKLVGGLHIQGKRQPFEKGLVRTYKLEDVDIEFFQSRGDSVRDYLSAAREAMSHSGQDGWNLALIQTDNAYKSRTNGENPYLVTKAFFLQHDIPSQDFRTQTVDSNDYELAFICNNIALACYAKMGGIPWLIQSDKSVGYEFVIGLGSASIGEGRLGARERVVGITTVFRGDGLYELSNVSRVAGMDDYQGVLLSSLKETIERVRSDNNWRPRENVRLIFHSFKPLRDSEARAVSTLMKDLGDYAVDYAFLHLAENHPFLMLDRNQQGVPVQGGQFKGVLSPTRGHFMRLSSDQVLLALKGAREVKSARDGLPRPLLLKLHRDSTFRDTSYLARQVFHFSCNSWQTFFPAPMPVTISYSQMIARMLGQFATLPNWNPDSLYGRIGSKRWFL